VWSPDDKHQVDLFASFCCWFLPPPDINGKWYQHIQFRIPAQCISDKILIEFIEIAGICVVWARTPICPGWFQFRNILCVQGWPYLRPPSRMPLTSGWLTITETTTKNPDFDNRCLWLSAVHKTGSSIYNFQVSFSDFRGDFRSYTMRADGNCLPSSLLLFQRVTTPCEPLASSTLIMDNAPKVSILTPFLAASSEPLWRVGSKTNRYPRFSILIFVFFTSA